MKASNRDDLVPFLGGYALGTLSDMDSLELGNCISALFHKFDRIRQLANHGGNSEPLKAALTLCREIMTVLPKCQFGAESSRGDCWAELGITMYYLLNPTNSGFMEGSRCAEAERCFERCLELTPQRGDIHRYLQILRPSHTPPLRRPVRPVAGQESARARAPSDAQTRPEHANDVVSGAVARLCAEGCIRTLAREGSDQVVRLYFTSEMREAVPAEKLREVWDRILAQSGAFLRSSFLRIQEGENGWAVYLSCVFARASYQAEVIIARHGRVSGLWIRKT